MMGTCLSLDFVAFLQHILSSDIELGRYVKNIFLSLKQSTKYPYIYHRISKIKLISNASISTYELDGEINIYFRETSLAEIKVIINRIEQLLHSFADIILPFKFISAKIIEMEFSTSNDHITSMARGHFRSIIQERLSDAS